DRQADIPAKVRYRCRRQNNVPDGNGAAASVEGSAATHARFLKPTTKRSSRLLRQWDGITPATTCEREKRWLTTKLCSIKGCRSGARCWVPNTWMPRWRGRTTS